MYKTYVKTHEKRQGRENKMLPNNQIIITCHMELQVQEMTMNGKLTMIDASIILSKRIKFSFMFLITLPPFHKCNSYYSLAALFHDIISCAVE